jgi:MFS family permease
MMTGAASALLKVRDDRLCAVPNNTMRTMSAPTRMTDRRPSPWPRIWILYGCGLLGAAQLGRLAALAPLIQAALALSLTTVAAAISLIEIGGATLGFGAGRLAHRLGLPRTLEWAVASLTLGAFGGALADGSVALIGWRFLEAAGYLGIIVSAPVLIAQLGREGGARMQGLALTLWSTFFPVGFALGSFGAAAIAAAYGWRLATAVGGAAGMVLWLALVATHRSLPSGVTSGGRDGVALTSRGVALALGFGMFTFFEVGSIALLPTLLIGETAMSAKPAGQWTALASVAAVGGSAVAAWILKRRDHLLGPLAFALGMPALLLFGLFRHAPSADVAIGVAVAVNTLGGVFIGLAFVLLPRVAQTSSQLVGANGLLAQCGATGSLLGPPVMAACVQHAGWSAAASAGLLASVLSLAFMARAVGGP